MTMKYLRESICREWSDENGNQHIALKLQDAPLWDVFTYVTGTRFDGYAWACMSSWENICKAHGGIDQKSDTIKGRKRKEVK
uniref:Uncharacterized protein n=1 Tax=Dulem virus 202 TaxID=3145679 RepID=A0AAU8AVR3_9VIRU